MKLTDGTRFLVLDNEDHISAFTSEGWKEVKEEPKQEPKQEPKKTIKKAVKK